MCVASRLSARKERIGDPPIPHLNMTAAITIVTAISEISESSAMRLSPIVETFVLHFGEMGSRWGINRTVGQIYALLYLSDVSLPADEITDLLGVSRSNVSMGLKELQSWNLVRLEHVLGDRREYFSAPDDIWQIVRTLAEQRRRREVDPTLSVLRDLIVTQATCESDRRVQARLRQMHDMIELLTRWADEIQKLNNDDLVRLLKLGKSVVALLELKDQLPSIGRVMRARRAPHPAGMVTEEELPRNEVGTDQ
ncbi:MAG: GbsR/MarR family transcriptional regulator [Acetobacteraceae bacterium]